MNYLRITGMSCVLAAIFALPLGCSVGAEGSESVDTATQALPPGQCSQAVAKDVLIAQLVKDSWITHYPLTRLSKSANGSIVGPSLPDEMAGDLELINTIVDARDSVARALVKISGLPDYVPQGIGAETGACTDIPAWTPSGTTRVDTTSIEVIAGSANFDSWLEVQKQFGKECPLIKRIANKDLVDPPSDGSSSLPPSSTVSAIGVRANAFGLCTSVQVGSFCKLSYATGVNWDKARICQTYSGAVRCVLY